MFSAIEVLHSDPLYCLGIYKINEFIQFHAGLKRRELF